jgi:hypothetical protein
VHFHENLTINPAAGPAATIPPHPSSAPRAATVRKFPLSFNTVLEYAGAALGITGWLGVRQLGSPAAQQLGFLFWVAGALILMAWGYHMKARAIMTINAVNAAMAASALLGMG